MSINYNFADAKSSVDEIPPPAMGGRFVLGPAPEDKPFLDFVTKSLRESGKGGMPFDNFKDLKKAQFRIDRWIAQEHDLPVTTHVRTTAQGAKWLYWGLADEKTDVHEPEAEPKLERQRESHDQFKPLLDDDDDVKSW